MTHFPTTEQLIIAGEDPRLALDATGANHYLCRPCADAELLRFGSSTATTISPQAFAIADAFRQQWEDERQHVSEAALCQHHAQMVEQSLRNMLQLKDSTAIMLTESGTMAHRQAITLLCEAEPEAEWLVLMIAEEETGRGVPTALSPEAYSVTCDAMPIRQPDGTPISDTIIAADLIQRTNHAIQAGKKVLMVLVDVSKSGAITPPLDVALQLREAYPKQLHLLLDGCQFRFSRQTLRAYLDKNIMVAITGSKFLAAPSFSAALLLPEQERQHSHPPHAGVLLRWHLACHTLQQFQQLDSQAVYQLIKTFAQAVQQKLTQDDRFSPLMNTPLHRPWQQTEHWDSLPTIFPFFLHTDDTIMTHGAALDCYHALQQRGHAPIQLGRPMSIQGLGVFRLCLSAPLIIEAIQKNSTKSLIAQAMWILDELTTYR